MKILHISTIREWRGGDAQMLTTYRLMNEYPDIQQIILCPVNSVLATKCQNEGIEHYTASRKGKQSVPFLKLIIKTVKQHHIDIIHVHDSNAFSLTLIALSFLPKTKLVYSRKRNNRIKNNYFKKLKYNSKKIDKIVCVSEAVRNVFKGIVTDMNKVITIYDGIDTHQFKDNTNLSILHKEYNLPEETKIVGNVAGLTHQKDLYTFIEVAKKVLENTNQKIKFFIIGEGGQKEDLLEYRNKHNLEKDIIFTGFRNDVDKVLPEFDVLLMTSVQEGLPLVIYEAFACNIPIVSTKAGGVAEAVVNNISGITAEVKDVEALANGVLKILNNAVFKEQLVAGGKKLSEEKYNLERMKKDYYKLYSSL
ncbi:glycosyltransferase family 4 protein [Abyssalbus ytuae]|uniref:Glycosyltransferase family 4 protein n=1 Tax=Abyssalbus ytuae TaxID=2926907 RepID=A0A9E7CTL6_9FLAO|nr:glycosyltransferase family 4 protein [Abyssalbus ytuae]UOB18266.1 glycosyltransferase family 4 protein [Abyssalbus ytuae]